MVAQFPEPANHAPASDKVEIKSHLMMWLRAARLDGTVSLLHRLSREQGDALAAPFQRARALAFRRWRCVWTAVGDFFFFFFFG